MTVLQAIDQTRSYKKCSKSTIPDIAEIIDATNDIFDNLIVFNSTTFEVAFSQYLSVYSLMDKLNNMRSFADNWDSYGAEPPSELAINSAIDFLRTNASFSLPYFFAAPGINGEVLIEFKEKSREAELFFNPDGSTELFLYENDECKLEDTIEAGFTKLIEFFNE